MAPWTERVPRSGGARRRAARRAGAARAGVRRARGRARPAEARLAYEGEPPTVEELDARLDRDLERGDDRARPAPRRRAVLAGDRDLRATARRASSGSPSSRSCSPRPSCDRRARGVPPLLLLDDVLSELDADRRAPRRALPAPGRRWSPRRARARCPRRPAQLVEVSPGRRGRVMERSAATSRASSARSGRGRRDGGHRAAWPSRGRRGRRAERLAGAARPRRHAPRRDVLVVAGRSSWRSSSRRCSSACARRSASRAGGAPLRGRPVPSRSDDDRRRAPPTVEPVPSAERRTRSTPDRRRGAARARVAPRREPRERADDRPSDTLESARKSRIAGLFL